MTAYSTDKNGNQSDTIFKMCGNKIKHCQSTILYLVKMNLKNESKINIFSD